MDVTKAFEISTFETESNTINNEARVKALAATAGERIRNTDVSLTYCNKCQGRNHGSPQCEHSFRNVNQLFVYDNPQQKARANEHLWHCVRHYPHFDYNNNMKGRAHLRLQPCKDTELNMEHKGSKKHDDERYGRNLPIEGQFDDPVEECSGCLLYTSPSPRDQRGSRMPSSA